MDNPHGCAGFESDRASTPSIPLAQIEDALDTLLTKLLAERKRQRQAHGSKPLRAISAAELAAMPLQSDREIWREIVAEHPITGALELAIHELGEVLFDRGGTNLMRDVLERVARRHPKTYSYRASIMDKKWDSIGGQWWC